MVSPLRHPKTGMLWFRQAVPEKLRLNVGAIMGRPGKPAWELKWTLGTHDVRGVNEAMLDAIKKADAIMEAALAWDHWSEPMPTDQIRGRVSARVLTHEASRGLIVSRMQRTLNKHDRRQGGGSATGTPRPPCGSAPRRIRRLPTPAQVRRGVPAWPV